MKKVYDKYGRTLYKFSSSVAQGGNLYAHKIRQGVIKNKDAAKEGGTVAGVARKELEQRSGEKVASSENYLEKPENQKRIELRKKK